MLPNLAEPALVLAAHNFDKVADHGKRAVRRLIATQSLAPCLCKLVGAEYAVQVGVEITHDLLRVRQ